MEGEWDYYLWGGFAFSVIKKDDTYFLYYQGSSDYRTLENSYGVKLAPAGDKPLPAFSTP